MISPQEWLPLLEEVLEFRENLDSRLTRDSSSKEMCDSGRHLERHGLLERDAENASLN